MTHIEVFMKLSKRMWLKTQSTLSERRWKWKISVTQLQEKLACSHITDFVDILPSFFFFFSQRHESRRSVEMGGNSNQKQVGKQSVILKNHRRETESNHLWY